MSIVTTTFGRLPATVGRSSDASHPLQTSPSASALRCVGVRTSFDGRTQPAQPPGRRRVPRQRTRIPRPRRTLGRPPASPRVPARVARRTGRAPRDTMTMGEPRRCRQVSVDGVGLPAFELCEPATSVGLENPHASSTSSRRSPTAPSDSSDQSTERNSSSAGRSSLIGSACSNTCSEAQRVRMTRPGRRER
jgi:hypothetical protein